MLDIITEFISNNTTMVIVAVIALVAMIGMFMFRPQAFKPTEPQQFQVPGMDMDMHMDNAMCNMDTGVCQPHQEMENQMMPENQMTQEMSPEMQQQMQQQQMQQQQMQQQMMQENQMTTEM